jgi:tetratricopeptide (TPR) repeat protein
MNLDTETEPRQQRRGTRAAWICCCVAVLVAAVAFGVRWGQRSRPPQSDREITPEFLAETRRAWESGRYADVVRALRTVPDDHPFGAEARFLEGRSLWKLNRWQAAEARWNRALELDPRVPQAGFHLLKFYYVEQRLPESRELALKLYEVEPEPRDRTLLLLELLRIDHERLTPAETVLMLEPVIALEPQNYHALRAVGFSYVELNRVADGLALIERAIQLDPAASDNWFALASSLDMGGNSQRFGELWKNIPEAAREEPRMLRLHGHWAESLGEFAEAERDYRRVLEADPADGKTHYALARLLRRRGAVAEANEHERISIEIDAVRERLMACYADATRLNYDPPAELCREISQLCRTLHRPREADLWEQEAARRSATGRLPPAARLPDQFGDLSRRGSHPSSNH